VNTSKLASPISTLLSRLWRPILEILSRCAELKVWEKTDRQGNHYWQGYDPQHGQHISFGTEDEIRMWIEQQYYR